jgi:hypothetical protein
MEMLKPLFFSVFFLFHPVHVSLTSIDFNPERNSFNVFVRMYFDDFVNDCKLNGIEIKNNTFSGINQSSKETMKKYLDENVILKVNGKLLTGKLMDMNMVDNEISMNLECKSLKKPKTLSVKNLIMTGLYNDQSNMIIVKINDFEEGAKLTKLLTEQIFILK